MQIKLSDKSTDSRRVDFNGNTVEGVFVSLVNEGGITYFEKRITETERLRLVEVLTRKDNGRAV